MKPRPSRAPPGPTPTPVPGPVLAALPVLVVDCQTTGATPQRGHLLELAWAHLDGTGGTGGTGGMGGTGGTGGTGAAQVQATFVALPDDVRIPPRITSLTGIAPSDLEGAPSAADVWFRLLADAGMLAHAGGTASAGGREAPVPAVAHFARFERAFLESLHAEHGDGVFPLSFLCTHEIACRLLPGLPRRGLKALAGRLGHVLGETKRAGAHVHATMLVWRELVRLLREDADVETLGDLHAWLEATRPQRRGGRDYEIARETRLDLPSEPGVYRMLGRGGEVLYLGKATSLRSRVNGYFQKRRHDRTVMPEMLTQAHAIDTTVTATPLEAALLETDEIKRYEPPYNVALRSRAKATCFATTDARDVATRPDASHVLGPLPHADALVGFVGVQDLVRTPDEACDEALWRRTLDVSPDAVLDHDVLRTGLTLLRGRHGLEATTTPGSLRGLGARLWKAWRAERAARREQQREAAAPGEERDDEDEPEEERREGPWTPATAEEVAAALESVVRHGAHLLRRARWLVELAESSVVWRPTHREEPTLFRHLEIEGGRVVRAEDRAEGSPPAPPGWPRTRRRRLDSFDLATYDRLRVLTTELRRLVAAGGPVQVAFSPRVVLDARALSRRLFWI